MSPCVQIFYRYISVINVIRRYRLISVNENTHITIDNKLKMHDAHKFKTHCNGILGTIEGFFQYLSVLLP